MKKRIALVLVLVFAAVLIIAATITVPQNHDWQRIFNGVVGANGDGLDTTSAFSAKQWEGVITLAFATDTAGYDTPDGPLTVWMQIKRKYTTPENQVVDQDWMPYYNNLDATDSTMSKVDTVSRALVNRTGEFYMNPAVILSSTGEWAWGDSVRFILQNGVGDSLGLILDVGGQ